jgi:hypothetical protein
VGNTRGAPWGKTEKTEMTKKNKKTEKPENPEKTGLFDTTSAGVG